jgi:hypothetical protein
METENSINLEKGEALIWDKREDKPVEEFLDFAINGLAPNYHYNFLVCGYLPHTQFLSHVKKNYSSLAQIPDVIGVCRGEKEMIDLFVTFSNQDYLCRMFRINEVTQELILTHYRNDN